LLGNCHTHRDTERSIVGAGFEVDTARREWTLPMWVPLPMSELALGRARRTSSDPAAPDASTASAQRHLTE
jgi:hypothetical protein